MSIGLFLFFLFVLVANIAIGYIIAVLLGIGPPDFCAVLSKIKFPLTSSQFNSGDGSSRLAQAKKMIGFLVSLVNRFTKHDRQTGMPLEESTTFGPISPTSPAQESSDHNPNKPKQKDFPS